MAHTIYKNKAGERIKSVTTIIGQNLGWNKEVLLAWYAREFKAGNDPTQKKQKAADKGTLCHHYISMDFYGKPIDTEFKSKFDIDAIILAEKALEKVKEYFKENKIILVDSELSLISEEFQYGGTLDARLLRDNKVIILGDIKTSRAIYEDHLIQLGAYNHLLIENNYPEPEEYVFIHIKKDYVENDENILDFIPVKKEVIQVGFEVFKNLIKLQTIKKLLTVK